MNRRVALCLVSAALNLCSCAGAPEHGDDLRVVGQAVVNGAADLEHPAAVAIVNRLPPSHAPPTMAFCSGVLLAPNVVLTAAHCVAEEHDGPYDVFFGTRVGAEGTTIPVAAVLVHSAYEPTSHAFDAALLRLAFDSTEAPYRIASDDAAPLEVGDSVRAVGFGVADSLSGFPDSKRSGLMTVAELGDDTFNTLPAPAMTCTGDSGGPVLVAQRDGEEQLIGLTVFGDPGCKKVATNQRVARLRDFIAPFIEQARAPSAGCSFDRQPTSSTTGLAPALALLLVMCIRRGQRRHS